MKTNGWFPLFAAVVCGVFTAHVHGSILLSESFSYADGALDQSGTGWSLYSGTGGQTISSGRLSIDDSGTGDFNRSFSVSQSSGTIYAGYTLTVSSADPPSSTTTDGYFGGFYVSGTTLRGRLLAYRPSGSTAGMFTLAISFDGVTFANWGTELSQNNSYRIVTSFDFSTKTSTLWVNALTESDTSVSQVGTANTTSIPGYAFRINGTADGDKTIDDLVVATTFNEALTPVPEPTNIALGIFAAGLLAFSGTRAWRNAQWQKLKCNVDHGQLTSRKS